MAEFLTSVGLDIGTTSTQMIVSRLTVENQASGFTVPEMVIGNREILYRSPVHFTPLLDEARMDAPALGTLIRQEYRAAGLLRENVNTGAVIITGETSRKENARAVLAQITDLAGDFVVATAGPNLESALAARGSGAVDFSRETGKTVLHMDIGGGTSNLALIRDGKILAVGCLNVGGRLVKFRPDGMVTYVSPVLSGLTGLRAGNAGTREEAEALCGLLTEVLEMAAGLREPGEALRKLTTAGTAELPLREMRGEAPVLSFSGGVAECIREQTDALRFGDLGPLLGSCIRRSRLCRGKYRLGQESIRATVIGAGCHSARLSGSTVFAQNVAYPLKNLPAAVISGEREKLSGEINRAIAGQDGVPVLALPGIRSPGYAAVRAYARQIAEAVPTGPVYLCLQADMAQALGQCLAGLLGKDRPILCLDRIKLNPGDYLDVAAPVGPAFPVVVKTLVMG